MFDFLLPILYAAAFGGIIYRAQFFKLSPGRLFLLNIFFVKCLLSVLYWKIHVNDYGGGDTFYYFLDGEIVGHTLEHDKWKYLQLVFGYNTGPHPAAIAHEIDMMGYWHDTSAYMVVRFNALVYLFSFGNPYVHGIFMSFLSLTGLLALYRGINKVLNANQAWIRFCIFGIPSVLFWTSGVHKEGLLIFGLGFFFYSILSIGRGERNWKYVNMMIVSALLVFLVRDFIFYLLVPGMFAWQASKAFPRLGPIFLVAAYVLCIAVGPQLDFMRGNRNYLNMIADKQYRFGKHMGGNTDIEQVPFHPTTRNMLRNLPLATYNATLRPFQIGIMPVGHAIIFFENLLLLALVVMGVVFFNPKAWYYDPLLAWMFAFGVSFICVIGLIVPNIGAIVRYRSIALPFVLIPLLYYIKPVVLDRLKGMVGR